MKDDMTYYLDDNFENSWTEELEMTMQELKESLDLPTEEVEKTLRSPPVSERRRAKRIEIKVPIHTKNGNRITESFTVDMNYNGCFIETEAPYEIGSIVQISLQAELVGIGGLLHGPVSTEFISAVVRWRRDKIDSPGDYMGMGVEFLSLSQHQRDQIQRILLISETDTLMSLSL